MVIMYTPITSCLGTNNNHPKVLQHNKFVFWQIIVRDEGSRVINHHGKTRAVGEDDDDDDEMTQQSEVDAQQGVNMN